MDTPRSLSKRHSGLLPNEIRDATLVVNIVKISHRSVVHAHAGRTQILWSLNMGVMQEFSNH